MFIDHIHLLVQAGNGGNGCDARLYRPDRKILYHGGDGGDGGSIIFRADGNASPLANLRFKQHIVAASGGHGGGQKKRGRNGENTVVLVPVGTYISDRGSGLMIRELTSAGEEVVVVKGGKGGVGNVGRKDAMPGERGEILDVELRMRLQADVFLIGLPNSGKSALLNALTRCHAKEESYPFTTKDPEIGVCVVSEDERFTLCELPSIYAHSHEGRGLGVAFLSHLESAKFILYVLEPVSQFAKSLADGYKILRKQLKLSGEKFLEIPHAVLVMKADGIDPKNMRKLKTFKPGAPVLFASIGDKKALRELSRFLLKKVCKLGVNLGK